MQTQVLIVGAGPVGLTLALDLGRRGVRCTLVEKNPTSIQLPKMERCNARTMEIFRRLGVMEDVRAAGLRADAPMDVFLARSMSDETALCHLPYPSPAAAKAEIAAHNDGRPLEPYQLISQYTLEPLLRRLVEELPAVTVRFGCELTGFTDHGDGVTGELRPAAGGSETIRARYIVGCDGGASTVRKQLGIKLVGQGAIRKLRQALFYAPELYERIPMGRGRHYHLAVPPLFPFIIIQDSAEHWTLHAAAQSDAEMETIFRDSVAMPIAIEMLSVNEWTQHLLCAEAYRDGNAFIAGDAAHLVIPTGGLGMNTGVGDAIDLGWKLAATLAGWGGPALLDGYEAERRPIGLRNVKASGAAMEGRLGWRAADGLDEMARRFDVEQRKVTEILGIECGYRYVDSPLICDEPGGPDPDNRAYVPTTWPGFRLPHVWIQAGTGQTALHDRLGSGYTLLRLGTAPPDGRGFAEAFRAANAPLEVLDVPDATARALLGFDLILVRPDLHVAWRGNRAPEHPASVTATAIGR
jgi:2-polyprenyl-6-methoxyphenol hydroxylase-like FAD-dependent oxidoreductase